MKSLIIFFAALFTVSCGVTQPEESSTKTKFSDELKGFLNPSELEKPSHLRIISPNDIAEAVNEQVEFIADDSGEDDGEDDCFDKVTRNVKLKGGENFINFEVNHDFTECFAEDDFEDYKTVSAKIHWQFKITSDTADYSDLNGQSLPIIGDLRMRDFFPADGNYKMLSHMKILQRIRLGDEDEGTAEQELTSISANGLEDGSACESSVTGDLLTFEKCSGFSIDLDGGLSKKTGRFQDAESVIENDYFRADYLEGVGTRFGKKFHTGGKFKFTLNNWENGVMQNFGGKINPRWSNLTNGQATKSGVYKPVD